MSGTAPQRLATLRVFVDLVGLSSLAAAKIKLFKNNSIAPFLGEASA
ncbi:MAG: hypothetical protein KGL29_00415 [Alphaproteobacteria bacterium]|nr:hypothetical protein [Alphaproteobacteria bacterium]MDE2163812.1 hypothetical protein [Alphaproteobacteria bacterium]MDE2264336.1 hypothetical protein [Alphaproteobacteria bacterium]MDE2499255.1 hypothetical protein [Alphaproteobacteria bacterium]